MNLKDSYNFQIAAERETFENEEDKLMAARVKRATRVLASVCVDPRVVERIKGETEIWSSHVEGYSQHLNIGLTKQSDRAHLIYYTHYVHEAETSAIFEPTDSDGLVLKSKSGPKRRASLQEEFTQVLGRDMILAEGLDNLMWNLDNPRSSS